MKQHSFVLVGGDVRQAYLGKLLAERGEQVTAVGLERYEGENWFRLATDLRSTCAEADVVVLPLPVMQGRGLLNAPLANAPFRITDVLDAIPAGMPVFGGSVPQMVAEMAKRRKLSVRDYLAREELAVRNAIPTAEGAIQIAMEQLPVTIHGLPVLVIGNGRIGSALAQRLKGLGAEVTVSARRQEDFARISSMGYRSADTRALDGTLDSYALIVNTVPAPILTRHLVAQCRKDVLLLDLASGEGGIAPDARTLRKIIHALSLPGKVAPVTAAADICDTVTHMLEEEQLL
ncbi:MAG: dipicolinate synthase subunit DpsA [Eubacteriales bacterium]|nr:dipicolinate synthase subunit DpsA [Eubacteriales bacterium]